MIDSSQTNGSIQNGADSVDYDVTRRTLIERGFRPVNGDLTNENTSSTIASRTKQHEDEQRELQELNSKLSTYLDHVHNLENFNGQLLAELENTKKQWGKDSDKLNASLAPELDKLRNSIDNGFRDKILQELQIELYESDIKDKQERINNFENDTKRRVNELEQEIQYSYEYLDSLKNQFDRRSNDVAQQRDNLTKLDQELDNLRQELLNQRLERLMLENELQTLREQAAFDEANYKIQREDILSLNIPAIDLAKFYRNELARAINDIRHDFEVLSQTQYQDLVEFYRIKTEEVKEKAAKLNKEKHLRKGSNTSESFEESLSTYVELNEELQALKLENNQFEIDFNDTLDDLQRIRDEHTRENGKLNQEFQQLREQLDQRQDTINQILENNVSLKFELLTYRNLLNSEEKHLQRSRQENTLSSTPKDNQVQRQKLSVKKTSTGSIVIDNVDLIEDSIVLTNTKSSDENLSIENWTIRRQNDQQSEIVFHIPSFILQPKQTIRILSKQSPQSARYEPNIIFAQEIDSWGKGQEMITRLIDPNNEEKANIVQKFLPA